MNIITHDRQRVECGEEFAYCQVLYYKGYGIEFVVSFLPRDPTEEYVDDAAVSYGGAHYVYDAAVSYDEARYVYEIDPEIDTHMDELRATPWEKSWLSKYDGQGGAQLGEIPEYCKLRILEFIEFFLRIVRDDPRSDMSVGMRGALSRARASFIERYAL